MSLFSDLLFNVAKDIVCKCTINGKRLQEIRENNGYSRGEVAKETLTTEAINRGWEAGFAAMNPSSGEISVMAEMFNMSEDEFREEINADKENDFDS